MFEASVRTAQLTRPVAVIKTAQMMMYREVIAVRMKAH